VSHTGVLEEETKIGRETGIRVAAEQCRVLAENSAERLGAAGGDVPDRVGLDFS
jgi:hypothetical protein